jgi:hypothetical protein
MIDGMGAPEAREHLTIGIDGQPLYRGRPDIDAKQDRALGHQRASAIDRIGRSSISGFT